MSEKPKLAVPYLRVSTDDKGQDPLRQLDPIKAWAAREGVTLLEPFMDEGTSGTKDPLERPVFNAAVDEARFKGAQAIVVEAPDRFTRGGIPAWWVLQWRIQEKHRLQIWAADQTLTDQTSFAGQLYSTIKAAMAKEWLDRHVQATKSGMARYKAAGGRMGQPPKAFSQDEQRFVLDERAKPKPTSWDRIALELCKRRGAFDVTDDAARYRRMVSEGHVRRLHKRLLAVSSLDSDNTPKVKVEA